MNGSLLVCLALIGTIAAGPGIKAEDSAGPTKVAPNDGTAASTYGPFVYDPSGNIAVIGSDSNVSSDYIYDPMGRVTTARVQRAGNIQTQGYTYDVYGNRTSVTGVGALIYGVDTTSNRLVPGLPHSPQYDPAGNMTAWVPPGSTAAREYAYDALNMVTREMTQVGSSTTSVVHVYTADDERYWSLETHPNFSNTSHYTIRDLGGRVLRDYLETSLFSIDRDYIYRDGRLLSAVTPSGTHHYSLDHLGTPRIVTDDNGYKLAEHTYYAFGVEITDNSPTDGALKFTGHERDPDLLAESNGELDYMHARYYSGQLGRFLSTDPVFGNFHLPQSFNRYTYALENPMRYIDPDGRQIEISLSYTYKPKKKAPPAVDWNQFFLDFLSFSSGVANSVGSNNLLGRGRHDIPGNDAYAFGHFVGDGVSLVQGALEINAGFGGAVGGSVLDLTGVGALIGVPVQIVSGAAIAHGATVTGVSAIHFMSGIKQRKAGKHGTFRGRQSKRANDVSVDRVIDDLRLNPSEQERLHEALREIEGEHTYDVIRNLAIQMFR